MKAFLCVLLFFLGTISSSQALVAVYRGTVKSNGSGSGGFSPSPSRKSVYLIVELSTRKTVTLTYFGTGEKKRYFTDAPTTMQLSTAPVPGGRTAVVLSSLFAFFTDNDNYARALEYFRGINGTVTIRTKPNPIELTQPRSFTGYNTVAAAENGKGIFSEAVYSLPLDAKETIEANNANRTIQAAYDALLEQLIKKGYKSSNE
ncbi:MAG TPA: hypothetical protein VF614_10840 [Chthoniobacteraceae bacterium]|jgi:hypothetical protein